MSDIESEWCKSVMVARSPADDNRGLGTSHLEQPTDLRHKRVLWSSFAVSGNTYVTHRVADVVAVMRKVRGAFLLTSTVCGTSLCGEAGLAVCESMCES